MRISALSHCGEDMLSPHHSVYLFQHLFTILISPLHPNPDPFRSITLCKIVSHTRKPAGIQMSLEGPVRCLFTIIAEAIKLHLFPGFTTITLRLKPLLPADVHTCVKTNELPRHWTWSGSMKTAFLKAQTLHLVINSRTAGAIYAQSPLTESMAVGGFVRNDRGRCYYVCLRMWWLETDQQWEWA